MAENAPVDHAIARCDTLMQQLIHTTGADTYCGFLTGSDNFRKKINLEYKANRKDQPIPQWLNACREFLITEWNCIITHECEADDYLGIAQDKDGMEQGHLYYKYNTIIASLDKDLKMIPGEHYNWVKDEVVTVAPLDGLKHFYKQMLIGDKADNIEGVRGLGPVKAGRLIDPLDTEEEMIDVVFRLYNEDVKRFIMNAQCLWIMRKEGETWVKRVDHSILPALLLPEVEATCASMIFSMDDISMEPTMTPTTMYGIPVNGESTESMEIETVPLTWSIPNELDRGQD